MKSKSKTAGFRQDLIMAWRLLPWLLLAYILFQGSGCSSLSRQEGQYRRWDQKELDSLWLECVARDPVYSQE